MPPSFLPRITLLATALVFTTSAFGQLSLDFNDYGPGEMVHQGNPGLWKGKAGSGIVVIADEGIDGTAAFTVEPVPLSTELRYRPASEEMNGFTPESMVEFSFEYRYAAEPVGTESVLVLVFGFRDPTNFALRLSIGAGGYLHYSSGDNASHRVVDLADQRLRVIDPSVWTKVSGVIDYKSRTYRLYVNEIEQRLPEGLLVFWGEEPVETMDIRLQNPVVQGMHVPVIVDNLTMKVVAE